jgi:hypothetical protein
MLEKKAYWEILTKNRLLLLVSSGIFLVFLSVCGLYFLSSHSPSVITNPGEPTPKVTVDAKTGLATFINKDGKYSVSYPENYILHVNQVRVQKTNIYHKIMDAIELDKPGGPAPYIVIQFSQDYMPTSIGDYIENSSECDAVTAETGKAIIVSNTPARIYKNIFCNSPETRVYIRKGNWGYNINFNVEKIDDKFLNDFLNNFKLL